MGSINLINNGSFENDTGWVFFGHDATSYVTDVHYEGNRSLRCTQVTTGETYHVSTYDIYLVPGKTYHVKFHATFQYERNITVNISCIPMDGGGPFPNGKYTIPLEHTVTGMKSYELTIPNSSDERVRVSFLISTSWLSGSTMTNVWLDALEVLGDSNWFTPVDRGTGDDQLVNGNFETTEGWSFTSDAGYSATTPFEGAKCLRFPINTTTNRQMASQTVRILRGSPYTLSLMAKRIGAKDLWAHYTYTDANGTAQFIPLPSLINSTSELYTLQVYSPFTVPADASSDQITLTLNAGDYTGGTADAYIDDVQLRGPAALPFTVGNYGETLGNEAGLGIRLYKTPDTGNDLNYHVLPVGSTFIIGDSGVIDAKTGNANLVALKYGDANGNTISAYGRSQDIQDTGNVADATVKERVFKIAESLIGAVGDNLGLPGNYCQTFLYWLCGATGLTLSDMPCYENPPTPGRNYAECGPARMYFEDRNQYHAINLANPDATYTPQEGDFVYYREQDPDDLQASAHVGMIFAVNENNGTYEAIEGNVGENGQILFVYGNYRTGVCETHSRIAQGFAHPSWV